MKAIRLEDGSLRRSIRERLASGRLPYDSIRCIWGGAGPEVACDACDGVIRKPQILLEGITQNGRRFSMHVACFSLWDAERKATEHEPSGATRPAEPDMTECAFCHQPILQMEDKATIQGVAYHSPCWTQQARESKLH